MAAGKNEEDVEISAGNLSLERWVWGGETFLFGRGPGETFFLTSKNSFEWIERVFRAQL